MATTLSPDRILRELADLWVSLGKQGQSESGAGVLRACSMTLAVLAEESEDVAGLGETIAALMPEHPARTILIRLRGDAGHTLAERVYAQCWMPFGQRRQICCEQIEITASDSALADLPSVLLPLTAPDLPVVVWCRSPRLINMPEFGQLAAMGRKVVLDSAGFSDSKAALRRMMEATRGGVLLGDLAWTRLTRARATLSQVFENRHYLEQLPRVSHARVMFGDGRVPLSALYMAAWVRNALADAGAWPNVYWGSDPALDPQALPEVELVGEGFRVRLAQEAQTLVVSIDDLSSCTRLPPLTDYLLVREELAIVRRDPVFERTLASAAALAYPTDK